MIYYDSHHNSMFKEKEIEPPNLVDVLLHLDLDEGIRIEDCVGCLSYITRAANEYTINICKGSDEMWEYAKTVEEAYRILRSYIKEPFKAWLY